MALTLASFNLLNLFDDQHDAKIRTIADHILAVRPQVIGVQEVGSAAALDRLRDVLRMRGLPFDHAVVGTPDTRGIRIALLSSLPFAEQRAHMEPNLPFPPFFDGDPHAFAGRLPLRRAIPEAVIRTPQGRSVCVQVVHWKSKRLEGKRNAAGEYIPAATQRDFGESEVRSLLMRVAEALYVRGLVDTALAHGHLACVLGDFNDTIDSTAVRLLCGRGTGEAGDPALYSAFTSVPDARRFSVLNRGVPSQIDHILVSRDLAQHVTAATIRNESLRDHGLPNDQPGTREDSDHALVSATFDV